MAYVRTRPRGLGQQSDQSSQQSTFTAQNVSEVAGGAAATAAQVISGNYVGAVGAGLLTAASIPTPATPFLAVAGAVAELLGAIGIGKGCGNTCIEASNFANQAGALMTQNMNTYLALPIPRAQSSQTAALNVFDQLWAGLISQQACGNPALGAAGKNCISARQQGACFWKASQGGWQQQGGKWTYVPWGPSGSGSACWNYFIGMRDPIANDPYVVPDVQAAPVNSSPLAALTSGGNLGLWLALGAAAVVAVMVL